MLDAWLEYHRATLALRSARDSPTTSCARVRCHRRRCRCSVSCGTWPKSRTELVPLLARRRGPDPPLRRRRRLRRCRRRRRVGSVRLLALGVRERAARSSATFASLDDVGRGSRRVGAGISVRWTLVHMIEEYARHNGHADFLREPSTAPPATNATGSSARRSVRDRSEAAGEAPRAALHPGALRGATRGLHPHAHRLGLRRAAARRRRARPR